jgi:hypothetical protein
MTANSANRVVTAGLKYVCEVSESLCRPEQLCNVYAYQGYWKNRPSQQLFKVFILYFIYFAPQIRGPCWPSSGGIHNYFTK